MALRRKASTRRAAPSHTDVAVYRAPLYFMANALDAPPVAQASYHHREDRHTTIVYEFAGLVPLLAAAATQHTFGRTEDDAFRSIPYTR